MKKFGQSIIIIIVAATVFLTGAGVTVIDYCCSSCGGQTLFLTQQHICCIEDTHGNDSEVMSCCSMEKVSKEDTYDNVSYTKDPHCSASRVTVDIDASSFRPHVIIPFVWISDASYHVALTNTLLQRTDSANGFINSKSPPEILPREYLSLIRVLII
ncbi:hypothetical protein JGH11_07490 [Dysgonomonas sp. Marseille-P4677]|uniref:hypothetical protein n=1 Tax=Dysgonomonas sp. Marseille-P4677 TaxID=2364790 RepID=UPI0019140605|nr:hypothetical protein [Dysgonomonas sp. Marseille-P4677]MBK5720712.1 hypothetical protein [Dysgonomonas sp. Marseille-P4677]